MKSLSKSFNILFGFCRTIRIWLQDGLIRLCYKPAKCEDAILITKLDAIGDYILFRNYLKCIRQSERFRNCKIILVGNILWKSLAEEFDKSWVDVFIWIDRKRFRKEYQYRWSILKEIRKYSYLQTGDFVYSRELYYGDAVNRVAMSPRKIAWEGDYNNTSPFWKHKADKIYSELISLDEILFEFEKNKLIVERFIDGEIKEEIKLSFGLDKPKAQPRIIVFPGASDPGKQWSTDNFVEVLSYFININPKVVILIGGSEAEKNLGDAIVRKLMVKRVNPSALNLCGKTTLPGIVHLINESSLLLSNDTSSIHIAASCKTTTICIAHGRHLGRFVPYPIHVSESVHCIFPFELRKDREGFHSQQIAMLYSPVHSVNEISADRVIGFIRKSNIIV